MDRIEAWYFMHDFSTCEPPDEESLFTDFDMDDPYIYDTYKWFEVIIITNQNDKFILLKGIDYA